MRNKRALALWCALVMLFAAIPFMQGTAYAIPENSYTYSFWGEPVPSPQAYATTKLIDGYDLQVGSLQAPQDLFVGPKEQIHIADTGNDRVVIADRSWKQIRIIDSFDHNGQKDSFNQPEGVFVNANGELYVADTGNKRIIVLNDQGAMMQELKAPESSLIRSGFEYTPTKVAVSAEGQVYVVSRGSYEGVMVFNEDGQFEGFIGTNLVTFNPLDLLWKRISTQEQREQMERFVPLEFNNMDLDLEGFLFTTTSEELAADPIKRLNPSGMNILQSRGYFSPRGDIRTLEVGSAPGSSIFVDIVADQAGMYHALDAKRGRIFSYDKDGNLLFVSGGIGSQQGKARTPVALDTVGDHLLVLDKNLGRIMELAPTIYGQRIRSAVSHLYNGEVEQATSDWQQVLALNSNFDVAYIGIGKSMLKHDEPRTAMTYFKLGNHRELYSEAFKRYRKEIVIEHFGLIVMTIIVAITAVFGGRWLLKRRKANSSAHYEYVGVLRNPIYTMLHPFNGFWEMKYERKGRISLALLILVLLTLLTIVKRQYSNFVVNYNHLSELNSLAELQYIVLPFLLWCVANWSLTTLMDGEGKFKDIVMATGYALLPIVIVILPQTLISHLMTIEESSFYYLLDTIAYGWALWLLFIGTMTVHQYTPGKTVLTMLLTVVVIGIILFLGLLFFSMMQQLLGFVVSIYRELSFRW